MLTSLRSSRLLLFLAAFAWAGSVHANGITVRITEVMSSSGIGGTNDWFEITNYGTTAVDITGWRMDDSSASFASSYELFPVSYPTSSDPAWTLLEPGESAVMLEVTTLTPADQVLPYQTFWNLGTDPANVRNAKIATYAGSGISFSSGGDGVVVFDSLGAIVAPKVTFGAATTGSTFYWSYDSAGDLATAAGGEVSVPGVADAYTTSSSPSNIGSPGIAVVAAPTTTLYWAADGATLGGAGSWTTAGTNWSAAESPVVGTTWADGATAVFGGTAGTVGVEADVTPLGLSFTADGYTLAAGAGSITTASVDVATGSTATVAAQFTGDNGLTLLGGGTLVLASTSNDYTGATSVGIGTLRAGASEVIPDASRLTVSRFMNADLTGYSETVNGIAGLGTITLGDSLTVNITGSTDVVIDGFLRGTGDLIIDSSGTGAQRLDASTQTLTDGAVKDYSGATLVRRGTLKVHYDGIPTQTSGVDIEAAGTLRLETTAQQYTFANNPTLPVNVNGGVLGQGQGDDVELLNPVNVTADSTFSILNDATPDPLNPTTDQLILAGPLTGTAGSTITITASNPTPGADTGRVAFTSPSGNTFTGTVKPQLNAVARFTGDYAGVNVTLEQGTLDGSGTVGAVGGSGTISPEGDLGPGILTAASITTSATTGFEFDFGTANAQPNWSTPTTSNNDVLRLTDSSPLANPLGAGNVVRLFLNVGSLATTDTFTGGFFTTADSTASISGGSYETYVYGDGFGTDYTHNDVGWYSLASYNAQQSSSLSTGIAMVSTSATFDGVTPTAGYVMQASYSPSSDIVIDVAAGSQTQAQAGYAQILVADSVTKTGSGTVVFDAANAYTGPTTVSAGTLEVANANAVASSAVTVASGATLAVASGTTMKAPSATLNGGTLTADAVAVDGSTGIATLTINSGTVANTAAVVVGAGGLVDLPDADRVSIGVASLAVTETAGGGKIDLGSGQVSIAAGGIAAADLRADIIAGRNGGAWDGTAGISSGAAAASSGTRAVGYTVAGDGSARVSFASPGDTNIDGVVDLIDLLAILSSGTYDQSVPAVWDQGDFNYDGVTDLLDLLGILGSGTYDQGNYFPAAPSATGFVGTVAAVPEPATTGLLLASAALFMLSTRRRR
jgi:fibronectin-binding autotransporter adhesin